MGMDKKVLSLQVVDTRDLECPIIAIYINPEDYPKNAVARLFDLDKPTNVVLVKKSLEELREDIIKSFPDMVRFDRAKSDTRSIVETWI